MVWPDNEPPQHQHAGGANDWELEPQPLRYAFPSPPLPLPLPQALANTDMARPPSASDLNGGGSQGTLTYSASCPSFTALYELSSDDDLIRDIQASGGGGGHLVAPSRIGGFQPNAMASGAHHHLHPPPLPLPLSHGNHVLHDHELAPSPPFSADKSFDFLLQMQHEHLDASLRAYPHQQAHFHAAGVDHFALFSQPRRPLHASASFTSLSSMESEYRRQSASKRKKAGAERWHKMQRHKSFDSTGTSPATSMAFSTYSGAGSSQFESTPEHQFLDEVPDTDMIGFSIDDFPSTFTPDASWPVSLTLGGGIPFEAYAVDDSGVLAPGDSAVSELLAIGATDAKDTGESQQTPADIDLLLSDHERANMSSLFDAIRDFEAPPVPTDVSTSATMPESSPPPPAPVTETPARPSGANKPKSQRAAAAKKRTHSPPLHPSKPSESSIDSRAATSSDVPPLLALRPSATACESSAPPVDAAVPEPPATDVPSVRERLEKVLAHTATHRRDERTPLTDAERMHLEASPLFAAARASETAGSLWLMLHAARCEFGCEIAGCPVMRRVVRHCLSCDEVVGRCKDPCNEAKTILLHVGACRSDTCGVCRKLREIDHAHNAITPTAPVAFRPAAASQLQAAIVRVPIAPAAPRPIASAKHHVPIQPNPLPTSSNPMGLLGTAAFPALGFSLALYLEQTSATFRAEVKARVEKRVTAAAGQDLIQHMQKKTRLRSLDDLRADARTLVLGELERELHVHLQAYAWAANNRSAGTDAPPPPQLGGHECMLPPYLLSVAAAGFATFYAQQASLHAAMTGKAAAAPVPGSSPSGAAPLATTSSRRKGSIGSASSSSAGATKTAKATAATLKTGTASAPPCTAEKKADAALAV